MRGGVLRAVLLLYRTEQLLYIGADPVKVILLTYEGQKPELLFLFLRIHSAVNAV